MTLLTCSSAEAKYVNSVSVYFQLGKNLYVTDFRCDLLYDSRQKQVNVTEVHLSNGSFVKKRYEVIGDQYRKETVKKSFYCCLKKEKKNSKDN